MARLLLNVELRDGRPLELAQHLDPQRVDDERQARLLGVAGVHGAPEPLDLRSAAVPALEDRVTAKLLGFRPRREPV